MITTRLLIPDCFRSIFDSTFSSPLIGQIPYGTFSSMWRPDLELTNCDKRLILPYTKGKRKPNLSGGGIKNKARAIYSLICVFCWYSSLNNSDDVFSTLPDMLSSSVQSVPTCPNELICSMEDDKVLFIGGYNTDYGVLDTVQVITQVKSAGR